jgi:hypothetical protein
MRRLLLIFLTACSPSESQDLHWSVPVEEAPKVVVETQTVYRKFEEHLPDPYQGWETWCENTRIDSCTKDTDCKPDRTGMARKCINPWWSKGKEKICAIPYPGKEYTKSVKDQVRRTIDIQCKKHCDADALFRFMSVISARESSWRPWKQHRLNPDIKAARTTWVKYRKQYIENQHYLFRYRWQGWGLHGENSGTFTMMWDKKAPPEVLCRPEVSTETWLRMARRAWKKQMDLGIRPTWNTIHAAVASGKVRPTEKALTKFRKQTTFDVDTPISLSALGKGFGENFYERNATAALLRADFIAAMKR